MDSIENLFIQAKNGNNESKMKLIERFNPLLWKYASNRGRYDEDCYQECVLAMLISIDKFVVGKE
ncbi:hypothetical protein RV11_GL003212 [Enterococcus phoeniculicola]|uniref:Helix-turn-helix conjugative transposon-like domain-containing protein n=1 Tax=Enterococcus phoeniculicola ATCC BAA-412 TaxID=1158610 RepID=R3TN86_9ENTE|nr:helix-turn-helix domain-containing protein [Enterococcus phoeniculicola]EOL42969.1 hypothetical protein UC3_01946 [Enterococcus phoeniculicola ATCC BAA-412]EOT76673.1 hypothetical protein I589_01630 [Enterococcus phoeniculicola ATCC BAA-412]OJG72241.1 hypothetical protein RV11_GL003212 [Enterococcus phoeniculicola]